ncbi:MAG: rod shape-determining protein MreC [Prevotella sp.]|nr:rod shape-determining protein MreC [Prevotella sp.]MDD7605460.1 rod shape-determining protein MreC [Prevotellaceae bacterium]MDY3248496.1 rod shape-determining protein MreC [Prevotella sp.]
MRNLLEFLNKYNHWFLFVLFEVIGLVLLIHGNSYQGSVWFSSANAVAGKVYEWDAKVASYFALSKTNEALTLRNIALDRQVQVLTDQLANVHADSTLIARVKAQGLEGYRLIPAKVIDNSVSEQDNLITIDRGAADGVRKDMGVVSGSGVVGIVYLVSAHYSVVIPVLNSQSNISCMIQGRGYFGYLHWTGGYTHMAYVDDVPRHARFSKSDNIVTSGYSAVFPAGIMVGKIRYVFNSPDGLSYRLKIQLATDFANLRDVCVIDNSQLHERIDILNAAKDSIQIKEKD